MRSAKLASHQNAKKYTAKWPHSTILNQFPHTNTVRRKTTPTLGPKRGLFPNPTNRKKRPHRKPKAPKDHRCLWAWYPVLVTCFGSSLGKVRWFSSCFGERFGQRRPNRKEMQRTKQLRFARASEVRCFSALWWPQQRVSPLLGLDLWWPTDRMSARELLVYPMRRPSSQDSQGWSINKHQTTIKIQWEKNRPELLDISPLP